MFKLPSGTNRIIYLTLSGLLLVGATASWHALGYWSLPAWALEWGDVTLAVSCIYIATKTADANNRLLSYVFAPISIVFSAISYYVAIDYTNLVAFYPIYYAVYAIPAIIVGIYLIFFRKEGGNQRIFSIAFMLTVLFAIMFLSFLFYLAAPPLPTDESTIDLYSAKLFLEGINPYNAALTANAFAYYNYPLYSNTPITTGGYVDSLTYPALSFILLIPSALFHIKGSTVMLPFFAIPIILTWYRGWKRKDYLTSVLILLPFLSFTIYSSQVVFSDLDIVWASLLMLSYYFFPNEKLSGSLFGLALSVKQFPAIAAPFLIIFSIREYGWKKTGIWILFAFISFMVVNGYFIAIGYQFYFTSIIENEFAPLIGVGFGISQISFLGFVNIPRTYFSIIMIALLLNFTVLYIFRYQRMKYSLFVFPIIIFFFNYRLFIQYLLYWMIISLLPLVDLITERRSNVQLRQSPAIKPTAPPGANRNQKRIAVLLALIIGLSISAGLYTGVHNNSGTFTINSVEITGYNSTGYVDSISVNITFNGNSITQTPVLFRIVISESIGNVNMLLWCPVGNITLQSGHAVSMTIAPEYAQYALPSNTPYRMIAYFGNIQGSYVSVRM